MKNNHKLIQLTFYSVIKIMFQSQKKLIFFYNGKTFDNFFY